MAETLVKEIINNLKAEMRLLIRRVKKEKRKNNKWIAKELDMGKSESTIARWSRGTNSPNQTELPIVVEKLKKILEPAALIPTGHTISEDIIIKETDPSYIKKVLLVSIFYDPDKDTIDYPGQGVVGDPMEINEKSAIIARKNETGLFKDAEGFIYVFDDALEPEIKYGWMAALKKTRLDDLTPGCYYFFITKTDLRRMRILEKVEKREDEFVFKMVSKNENIPVIELKSSQIEVIFRIRGFALEK